MEKRKRGFRESGSVLIICLIIVTFLAAMAITVMNPAGTADKVSTMAYNQSRAAIAANSVAERVKYNMCQDGAVPADGTSLAVQTVGWVPVVDFETPPIKEHINNKLAGFGDLRWKKPAALSVAGWTSCARDIRPSPAG